MQSLPELMLSDFNVYRFQTKFIHDLLAKNAHIGWLKSTPERLELMGKLIGWCRERKIEPRLWLFFLFKVRGWRFPPKFEESHLCSEKTVQKFQSMRGLSFFRRRMRASSAVDTDVDIDPNRDVLHSVEALKATFQKEARSQKCMDDMLSTTLGFHPQSKVCAVCPVQVECAIRLEATFPFSMLALRSHRLTAAMAQISAMKSQKP